MRRGASRRTTRALVLVGALCGVAAAAAAELPLEQPGRTETLPSPPSPHWLWVYDIVLRRSALLDLDDGRFLGMVSTGYLSNAAAFPMGRREFYLPETYYSRGSRGERSDVVTFYDSASLAPTAEVVIPPRRAVNVLPIGNLALSDDERFLAVFNMTPATSLSVVDVENRRFVGEIATPGCGLVYAAGDRRFFMLCGDGALLTVTLDEAGRQSGLERSEPFFDPQQDPLTEKAVRIGDTWYFVSFDGSVQPIDVGGDAPAPGARWSLLNPSQRKGSWRIGGTQHLAAHAATGRLYALMHQGGPDTHKSPGTELWVYDVAKRERVQRIELQHPGIALMSEDISIGRSWIWPFDGLWDWLLDNVIPNPGLDQIQVTQDGKPLLVTGSQIGGSLAVYDANSGQLLRRVASGNLTTHVLQAPWGAPRRSR